MAKGQTRPALEAVPFERARHSSPPKRASERATPAELAVASPVSSLETLPPLLTVTEVAAALRTSRKAVYAMAERSQLPGITRIGRRLLVRRDDLVSFLDERRAPSRGGVQR